MHSSSRKTKKVFNHTYYDKIGHLYGPVIHICCRVFGGGKYETGLSLPGFGQPIFHMRGKRSHRLHVFRGLRL